MKGLIIKDFLLLKSQLKSYVVLLLLFACISYTSNDNSFLTMVPIFGVMLLISTLSYDSYYKWDAFCLTLPNSRKGVVQVKYLLSIIITLIFVAFASIMLIAFNIIRDVPFTAMDVITQMSGALFGATVALSLTIPLTYKFGSENGRIIMIIAIFSIGAAVAGLTQLPFLSMNPNLVNSTLSFISTYFIPILFIITLFIFFVSYLITLKIYNHKEF